MKAEEAYHVNSKIFFKMKFHDLMCFRILLCYLLRSIRILLLLNGLCAGLQQEFL